MNIGKFLRRLHVINYNRTHSAIHNSIHRPTLNGTLFSILNNQIGVYSIKYWVGTRKQRIASKKSTPSNQDRPKVKNLNNVLEIIKNSLDQGDIDKAAKISLGLSNQLHLKGATSKQQYLAQLWQTAAFCFKNKSLDVAESVMLDLIKQPKQQLQKLDVPIHDLYMYLGIIRTQKNDYKNAIKYFEKCLSSQKGQSEPFFYMYILSQIVALEGKQENFKQAMKKCSQYWELYDKHKLQQNKETPIVISMIDVIKVEYLHGDTPKALKYLREANQLCEKLTRPQMFFQTYDKLIELNQLVEFDRQNDKAISRYLTMCQDQFQLFNRYMELAFKQMNAKWKLKDYITMDKYVQNLQNFMSDRRIKKKDFLSLLSFYKGISYLGQRNFQQSIKCFENAIKLINAIPMRSQPTYLLQFINLAHLSLNTYLLKDEKFIQTVKNLIRFVEETNLPFVNMQDLSFLMNREDKGQMHNQQVSKTIDMMIKTYIHSKLMKNYIEGIFKPFRKKLY